MSAFENTRDLLMYLGSRLAILMTMSAALLSVVKVRMGRRGRGQLTNNGGDGAEDSGL